MEYKTIRLPILILSVISLSVVLYLQISHTQLDYVNYIIYLFVGMFFILSLFYRRLLFVSIAMIAACIMVTTNFEVLSKTNPTSFMIYYMSTLPIFIIMFIAIVASSTLKDEYEYLKLGIWPVFVILIILYVSNLEYFAIALINDDNYKANFRTLFENRVFFKMFVKSGYFISIAYLFNVGLYFYLSNRATGPYKRKTLEHNIFDY